MKKNLSIVACFAVLAGCAGTPSPHRASVSIPQETKVVKSEVKQDILQALYANNWRVLNESTNPIHALYFFNGKHRADVKISYSSSSYKINYHDSDDLNYKKKDGVESIHGAYLNWTRDLEESINENLAASGQTKIGFKRGFGNFGTEIGVVKVYEGATQKDKEIRISGVIYEHNGKPLPKRTRTLLALPGVHKLKVFGARNMSATLPGGRDYKLTRVRDGNFYIDTLLPTKACSPKVTKVLTYAPRISPIVAAKVSDYACTQLYLDRTPVASTTREYKAIGKKLEDCELTFDPVASLLCISRSLKYK